MPQMSPMNWMILYMYMLLVILLINLILNYMYMLINKKKIIFKKNKNNYKWLW